MSKLFHEYFKREGAGTDGEYVIFNIISDDGSETIALYNYFPNARIYALEGDATMAPICFANLAQYADRVTFTATATTNYDGSMILHGNEVPCARLDTFIKNNSIPRVDFLLINHKKGVMSILEGLGDYLQSVQYLYSLITYYEVFTGQVIDCNEHLILNNFRTMDPLSTHDWLDNAMYCNNRFDAISCIGAESADHIAKFAQHTLANVEGIHSLYLVVPVARYDEVCAIVVSSSISRCVVVSESVFPDSVRSTDYSSCGIFHQIIHLCAWRAIPGITNRYLAIDSNLFFSSVTAFTNQRVNLYSFTSGLDPVVFAHMHNLSPIFRRMDPDKSGECGHMMFEVRNLINLCVLTELIHGQSFELVYLNFAADLVAKTTSEYELYFNYLLQAGYSNYEFRVLPWTTGTVADVDAVTDVNYVVVTDM